MEKTLHRDAYLDPDWFRRECRDIFFSEWFCVARSDELAAGGDYLAVTLAGENLLIVRGEDDKLRAFFNVCRHRGCQLIDSTDAGANKGRFRKRIRCPYHSWSYGLDGSLQNTPHLEVNKSEFPLHDVPLEEWGGFVFLHIAKDPATSLLQQLGPIPERVQRYPLHELVCRARFQYKVAANWKVILENYNECYHCAGVHPELCTVVPAFRDAGGQNLDWEAGVPQREGTNTFTRSGTTNRPPMPGLNDVEKERHFGELIYPNLMLSLAMDHAAAFLLWPTGPAETVIDCQLLFHPNAVDANDFNPADSADFWDLVNRQDWSICERVQRGMQSMPFEHGYYAPMEDMSLDIRDYVRRRMK